MRKNAPYIVLIVIFLLSVIILTNRRSNGINKVRSQLKSEFPMLNIDDEVTGQISKIHQPYSSVINNDPNNALVTINDSLKMSFTVGFENETGPVLDKVLRGGDLLLKKRGEEELLILRITNTDTLIFRFKLTDGLGYPLKKQDHDNL